MNNGQKELYNEWKRIEIATTLTAKVAPINGNYGPVKSISPDDILNLTPVRERVWKEMKEFLSQEERVDLGVSLNKSLEEIYG